MADFDRDGSPRQRIGNTNSERILSDRMMRLENNMQEMAAHQQAQFNKLIEMAAAKPAQKEAAKPEPASTESADRSSKAEESGSASEDDEWSEYFGASVWTKEQDKTRKNPFDQRRYGKKGDTVTTFEELMVITFKTLAQFLELKYGLRGVVRHGLSMAEKAAKDVYEPEAFARYDESVRNKAGQVGPSAFGTVEHEDVLRFFTYDNVKQKGAAVKKPASKPGKPSKKEKTCLHYNDAGCSVKACPYAHKCLACEEWGHSRSECKNLKKKDKK